MTYWQTNNWSPLTGDGLGPNVYIGEESVITVDPNGAGPGKVSCAVATPDGGQLDTDVVENKDGTFDIFYTPPEAGNYTVNIHFGGEAVPNSPWRVKVRLCCSVRFRPDLCYFKS